MGDATPMVFLDPPEHTAMRRLVTRELTTRKVSALEPAIRAFVVKRLERLREMGSADIVAELFKPLPSFVVAHYLGVPDEDRVLFDRWTAARLQSRVVLEELLARCPGFQVDVEAGTYAQGPYVRRHLSLPWTSS